ncbi:MAG: FAD-dependent oxidoreductase [Polyangiales bacterium]
MRVAVVGGGAAGLTSAWLLQSDHDVVVYESAARAGGHAHTVSTEVDGRSVNAELGAEFFFEQGYGGLHALIERLGLTARRESLRVSLSLPDRATPVVVPPMSPRAAATCASASALRDLFWLRRFGVEGERVVREVDWGVSVGALAERCGAPRDVVERLIVPLVASSWGVSREQARSFAAYSVVRVMGLRASQDPHSFRLVGASRRTSPGWWPTRRAASFAWARRCAGSTARPRAFASTPTPGARATTR